MGNYTAVRPHVYVDGAVILAANHNDNELAIYNPHNAAFNATTGHGHTGATGDGPKLGPTGLNLASAYTWGGLHTFNAGFIANASTQFTVGAQFDDGAVFNGDVIIDGSTLVVRSATHAVGFNTLTPQYKLDARASASGENVLGIWASTATGLVGQLFKNSTETRFFQLVGDFTGGTERFRLYSDAGSIAAFSRGGSMELGADLVLNAGQQINFRGGSDVFIRSDGPDNFNFYTSGVSRGSWSSTALTLAAGVNLSVESVQTVSFNGGTNTVNIRETSGELRFRSANTAASTAFQWLNGSGTGIASLNGRGEILLGDVGAPTAANYSGRRGFAKAWGGITAFGPTASFTYNCSITALGSGQYSVTLTVPFLTINYAVMVTGANGLANNTYQYTITSNSTFTVRVYDAAGSGVSEAWSFVAFGSQ